MNWWILEVSLGIINVRVTSDGYKRGWISFHLDRSRKLGIYFYSLKLYCVLNIVTNLLRRQVQYPTYFQVMSPG